MNIAEENNLKAEQESLNYEVLAKAMCGHRDFTDEEIKDLKKHKDFSDKICTLTEYE